MIIELYKQKFEVRGFPVIEGNTTKAYAVDKEGNIFLLLWPAGKEPIQGIVQLVKLGK